MQLNQVYPEVDKMVARYWMQNITVHLEDKIMKKYQVGVKIFNSFEVEANSEEEAEQKVRELDVYKTLMDCDYNITYVDERKGKSSTPNEPWHCKELPIVDKMSRDLLDLSKNKNKGFPTGTVDFGTSME
jgi:hypothetical protein